MLLKEIPNLEIIGTDISETALTLKILLFMIFMISNKNGLIILILFIQIIDQSYNQKNFYGVVRSS